ncbi:hypothetical protein B484DRAFT_429614 [Ochromonadaceae sp. CCMP2298]|nr:hypothetical protein B484DRAFT_429614 [Ochromonadaceae sp. CCMP2298]
MESIGNNWKWATHDEIKAQIIELQDDYMRDLAEVEDEWEDKKEFAKTMKVILSLQSIGRRKAIVTILIENVVVKGIVWNKNPNLFLFTDHIYSFTEKKYIAPDPDDYMNFTCGYPRGDISNEYEEEQIWLRDSFFYSCFEDKEVTDYLLRVLSSFLRGRPPGKKKQQVAHFWTGRGANGKSSKLMEDAFGNYLGLLDAHEILHHFRGEDKDHQTPYPEQVLEANRQYIASTKHVTNWFNEKMGMATDCFVEEPVVRIMDVKSFCENNDGPHKKFAAFKRDLLQIVKRRGDTSRGGFCGCTGFLSDKKRLTKPKKTSCGLSDERNRKSNSVSNQSKSEG